MTRIDELVNRAREIAAGVRPSEDFTPARPIAQPPQSVDAPADLAGRIEHTLLKPEASLADVERLCGQAVEHRFFGVCVNPIFVKHARALLAGSPCRVVTVIGFPLGASSIESMAREVGACADADEFDMVLPIGLLQSAHYEQVFDHVRAVVVAAQALDGDVRPVKVILEAGMLTPEQISIACFLAARAGAQFVKTSTGFNCKQGATVEDVALMNRCVGERLAIKAAGGIRDYRAVKDLVEAGACRIGSSRSCDLVRPSDG